MDYRVLVLAALAVFLVVAWVSARRNAANGLLTFGFGVLPLGLAIAAAATAVKIWLSTFHSHKPTNVSNVTQVIEPDAFAAGSENAYFCALDAHASGTPPRLFSYSPDAGTIAPIGDPLEARATSIAVVPGASEQLLFVIAGDLHRWGGSRTPVTPSTTPPQSLVAVRANDTFALLVGSPAADQLQLYSIDLQTNRYAAVSRTLIPARRLLACELSLIVDQAAVLLTESTSGATELWIWPAGGEITPVREVTNPRNLVADTDTRFLLSGQYQGRLAPLAIERGEVRALTEDRSLEAIHGVAAWQAHDWVLGTAGGRVVAWEIRSGRLEPVDANVSGASDRPRSLIPLGRSLGFVTGDHTCWNLTFDDASASPNPTQADRELHPTAVIQSLWPFRGESLCSARAWRGSNHAELFHWWTD